MDLGPTGENAMQRLETLRKQQRLSYAELSRMLSELGRDIPPLGLRRMEAGERRIDVDDLVALAVALKVSPLALLMPASDSADETFVVTSKGLEQARAAAIWEWLTANEPLPGTPSGLGTTWAELRATSWPRWLWDSFNAGGELQKRKRRIQAGRGPKGEN